jgi:diguanylate cyclase (GGDEF)-like protein/PAS domain S-box-containing protein
VPELLNHAYALRPLAALTLATGTLVLLLGIVVTLRERFSRISALFLAVTLSVAFWLFAFSMMYATSDPRIAFFWAKVSFLGIAFIPAAVYHFVVALARQERRLHEILRAMWVLSALFALIILSTNQIVDGVEKYAWGFYPRYAWASGPYLLFFFFGLGGALRHSVQAWRAAETESERRRMEWVSFSLCVGYVACFDYLPSFGIGVLPVGFLALVGFVLMMGHTVWRYELAEITASTAASRILETTRGHVVVIDRSQQIRVISDAVCRLLGYSEEELVGKPLALISEGLARLTLDTSSDAPFLFEGREFVWVSRGGEPVDVIVSAATINDRSGRAVGILYNADDISRHKKEEALRESEARYRTLVESMKEGVMLVNNNGTIQFVNQRMADMLGYMASELAGKPAQSLIDPGSRDPHGETTEMRRRIKLRTLLGRDLWVELSEAPLVDGKGNVIGSIRVHTDITDKRRAEIALKESEARYRLLAEFATDMISRHTPDGRILYASPAARNLLGFEPEELIGTRPADLIHTDDVATMERLRKTTLNSSAPVAVTYRLRRKDGTYVWVETTWRPIRDRALNVTTEIVAVSRDVTERKRAEQQIEYQAYHDIITGLPNQVLLQDRLKIALAHAKRQQTRGIPSFVALLLIDLDRLKSIGEGLGHSRLDWLIQAIGARFRDALRAEDTVARFGIDQFLVLLQHLDDPQQAAVVANKILTALEPPLTVGDESVTITASISIAVSPLDGDNFDTLVRNADAAMRRAHDSSRNSYQFVTPLAVSAE